jgi:hypothetical protein
MFLRRFNAFSHIAKNATKLFNRSLITGRATIQDTKLFVESSGVAIPHVLSYSKLHVNPVIHGPPNGVYGCDSGTDFLISAAIFQNGSNCICVYSKGKHGVWYTNTLNDSLTDGVTRSQIVTIAYIGQIFSTKELIAAIDDAWTKSQLEYIDVIVLQVNTSHLTSCLTSYSQLASLYQSYSQLA